MRPTLDETMLKVAKVMAERGTCARRMVGCVLVNSLGHILSSGYNGVASSLPHCSDSPCPGANEKSGSNTSLYLCEAIHAEQNALLQCPNVQEIHTCYVTCSPCIQCTKLLMNSGCKRIVYIEPSSHLPEAFTIWSKKHKSYMEEFGAIVSVWEQVNVN